MTDLQPIPTTTDAGIPVESDEHSLTIGPDGRSCFTITTSSTDGGVQPGTRARAPATRKGSGAFGRFEVTQTSARSPRPRCFSRARQPKR